ncbi:LPXTG cell wall anchor domain-containing protein [Bacillus pseudomycoides]|uniref:LPXTG cell wall anchor domain-containing protein n=1 Tax=Bacillus bingmayongensis TaxID=1150157 RepID=A0ABU5K081_9BACI|nr:LPXTG cell wall anchor domain-containing protein [Bacillus pseudomycoides]
MGRNKLCLSLGIILMCLSIPVVSTAAESHDYQSNGEVSFFGKYIDPSSEAPTGSGNSSETGGGYPSGNLGSDGQSDQSLEKIPQTGDASNLGIVILGLLFTVSVFYMVRKYKKMQWSENL